MTRDLWVMIRLDPSLKATNPASVETSITNERSANDGAGYHSRGGTSLSGVSAAWRGERGGGSVGGRQSVMSKSVISQSGTSSDGRASSSSQAVIDASRFPAKFAKTLKAVPGASRSCLRIPLEDTASCQRLSSHTYLLDWSGARAASAASAAPANDGAGTSAAAGRRGKEHERGLASVRRVHRLFARG